MPYAMIKYEILDNILTITLDRPQKLNALCPEMIVELVDAFDCADADDDVRAIIVTGAGRAFCAGADLSAGTKTFDYAAQEAEGAGAGSPVQADGSIDWGHEAVRDGGGLLALRIFDCLKPVIAAVNGPAAGAGVSLQLPMDIRLASQEARFGLVFTRRGIVPESCAAWFLPRVVGISRALEWTYTGRVISAQEALEGGLVRALYAPEQLLPAARALASEIAQNTSQVSVALSRQMLWRMLGADHPMEAHKIDSKLVYARGHSADVHEGVQSFLEKRPARYPDRVSKDMPEVFPWWTDKPYR